MSRFRKVDGGTWGDARFVALSQDAKLLWLYLLTGPHVTSLPGLFHLSRVSLAESLGWSTRKLDACVAELTKDVQGHPFPMAKVDWKSRVVWLPNAARHNRPTNRPTVVGWEGHWKGIPECPLKEEATEHLRPFLEAWGAEYASAFNTFAGSSLRSNQPSNPPSNSGSDVSSDSPSNTPFNHARARVPSPSPSPSLSDRAREKALPPGAPIVEIGSARCERVCEIYVEALGALSWPRGPVRERWERQALCDAINAHLRADETLDGVLAELRRAVGEWVAAYGAAAQLTSGWGAKRFRDWLAEGRTKPLGRAGGPPTTRPKEKVPPYLREYVDPYEKSEASKV